MLYIIHTYLFFNQVIGFVRSFFLKKLGICSIILNNNIRIVGVFVIQIVYKNKLYIGGKFTEVLAQLKMLQRDYKTVKEFLDSKMKDL